MGFALLIYTVFGAAVYAVFIKNARRNVAMQFLAILTYTIVFINISSSLDENSPTDRALEIVSILGLFLIFADIIFTKSKALEDKDNQKYIMKLEYAVSRTMNLNMIAAERGEDFIKQGIFYEDGKTHVSLKEEYQRFMKDLKREDKKRILEYVSYAQKEEVDEVMKMVTKDSITKSNNVSILSLAGVAPQKDEKKKEEGENLFNSPVGSVENYDEDMSKFQLSPPKEPPTS